MVLSNFYWNCGFIKPLPENVVLSNFDWNCGFIKFYLKRWFYQINFAWNANKDKPYGFIKFCMKMWFYQINFAWNVYKAINKPKGLIKIFLKMWLEQILPENVYQAISNIAWKCCLKMSTRPYGPIKTAWKWYKAWFNKILPENVYKAIGGPFQF